ncbi:MAG: methyltransferase domain-containing protein [Bacteriovorax sp.]|nr:methyltransferase domain-containing protein [Bacteriovorax sp.]
MNDEIIVLSEIEAVRTNPSMYIGSVSNDGVNHLLFELVHNAIDEAILGTASEIEVNVGSDFCSVEDNGRGISTEINREFNISNVQLVLTKLHSGSKFKKTSNHFTAGLHGVGLSCVNALSTELKIEIKNATGLFFQTYKEGSAIEKLVQSADEKSNKNPGTKITFYPDKKIFKEFNSFDFNYIHASIEELAFLNPQITFRLNSQAERFVFDSTNGIAGILDKALAHTQKLFNEHLQFKFQRDDLSFDCVFNWTTENNTLIKSYVNGVSTFLGGTHVNAYRSGLRRGLKSLISEYFPGQWDGLALEIDEALDGVFAIINCKLLHPNFEGQTKSRLTNFEIVDLIENEISGQVIGFFKQNSKNLLMIFERLQGLRKSRSNAKRVAERIFLQYGTKKINEEVYKKQFGERSKTWHSSAVWITDQELLKAHADHFTLNEDAIALDVCCGSGVVGASFKHKVKKIIGLDLTPEMVNLSKTRLDEVHQGNVYNIPFAEKSFDLVCTREVLHLLPYPENPVSEIFRVLKPGGQFVVGQILPFSEVDSAWMYRIFKKKQPLIFNMFQEEDFRNLLLGAGFVDLVMTEINVWENIDVWINSYETTALHQHEIREIYQNASNEIRKVHPFKILPNGEIHDLWRWCIFSVRKPLE